MRILKTKLNNNNETQIQCGDVEKNPGPVLKYTERLETVCASSKDTVKIFSPSFRSVVCQNSTLKQLMDGRVKNTIYRNMAQNE